MDRATHCSYAENAKEVTMNIIYAIRAVYFVKDFHWDLKNAHPNTPDTKHETLYADLPRNRVELGKGVIALLPPGCAPVQWVKSYVE